MDGEVDDKILAPIAGRAVIDHSFTAFAKTKAVQHVIVVVRDAAQQAAVKTALDASQAAQADDAPTLSYTNGGAERQDSVWAGLQAAPEGTEIVLIHDAARPCIAPSAIVASIETAARSGAACLARPVTDSLKSADPYDDGYLATSVDRSKLWATETPQTFQYSLIRDAYQNIIASKARITDDLAAIEALDQPVVFVRNPHPNPKLTEPQDLPYLSYLLFTHQD